MLLTQYFKVQKKYALYTREKLVNFRLVASTCMSSGYLTSLGVEKGFFTHILIDEAGQGLLPECLVSLALAGPKVIFYFVFSFEIILSHPLLADDTCFSRGPSAIGSNRTLQYLQILWLRYLSLREIDQGLHRRLDFGPREDEAISNFLLTQALSRPSSYYGTLFKAVL